MGRVYPWEGRGAAARYQSTHFDLVLAALAGFVIMIINMSKMSTLLFCMFDLIAPFLYCHESVSIMIR